MAVRTSKGVFDTLSSNLMPIVIFAQSIVILGYFVLPHVCR